MCSKGKLHTHDVGSWPFLYNSVQCRLSPQCLPGGKVSPALIWQSVPSKSHWGTKLGICTSDFRSFLSQESAESCICREWEKVPKRISDWPHCHCWPFRRTVHPLQGRQVTLAKRPPQMLTEDRMARRTVVTSQDWTWIAWKLVQNLYRNECLFICLPLELPVTGELGGERRGYGVWIGLLGN